MTILFTRFPLESALGGAEIQTLSLMEGLSKHHAVSFLGSCSTLLTETKKRTISSTALRIGPPPVSAWLALSFLWRKRKMQKKLMRALEHLGADDALFMLSLSEKLLITRWLSKKGVKVFWIEHDRIGNWLTKNPWLPLLKTESAYATTICVSDLSKKLYLDLGWDPEKTIAIPNGIDGERFSSSKAPEKSGKKDLHIGCIARLSEEKGIDVLIDAVHGMTDIHLTIVGKGPQEAQLHVQAENESRIQITPSVPDLGAFYRSLDILVLPSREHDPFGLVVAEAMMLGIPVIVTDACGIAGYLRNKHDAVIVEAGKSDALRKAIQSLRDPILRSSIALQGEKTARKLFSVEVMVEKYEALLASEEVRIERK